MTESRVGIAQAAHLLPSPLWATTFTLRAAAVDSGAHAIVLSNQKGTVLELSCQQIGLMANADLSRFAISLKQFVARVEQSEAHRQAFM